MLDTPKKQFLLIGALEAASSILGFIGAAKLPGMSELLCQHVIECFFSQHWLYPTMVSAHTTNACHACKGVRLPFKAFKQMAFLITDSPLKFVAAAYCPAPVCI